MWDQLAIGPPDPQIWDPLTGSFVTVPINDNSNIFCAGHAPLPDGRVLVVGGHITSFVGLSVSRIFDPATNQWAAPPDMNFVRWYPSVTALPDGRMLVTSGAINCEGCNANTPETYDPANDSWTSLTSAALALPLYPHLFVLSDGRILNTGSYEQATPTRALNLSTQTWTTINSAVLNGGSAAMYLPGKIIKSGIGTNAALDVSSTPSTATTYVLDMNQPTPSWRQTASMANRRDFHNLTILPDGKVLVTGGGTTIGATDVANGVLPAEMWDPSTEAWTTMASMHSSRLYHSTAVLMPDARVLITGGGRNAGAAQPATDQLSGEIYSPPYLFRGPRPAITSAPATVSYGQAFTVQTPDASRIAKVVLMRLSSVTHGFNWNQRYVPVNFTVGTGSLSVTAPANANQAPPGYYMLFIVDTNGVPSVATMVRF